jgi:hypothetical protein
MSFNPTGKNPILSVRIGGASVVSSGEFKIAKNGSTSEVVVGQFNNINNSSVSFDIDPGSLIQGQIKDLDKATISWLINFDPVPLGSELSFSCDVNLKQAGNSIFSVAITEKSVGAGIAKSGQSMIYLGAQLIL